MFSYRGIIEDQVDLICRYRVDGKLALVNGAYARALRRKRIDLIDQSIPIIEADRNNREDNGSNSGASRAGEGSTPRFTLQGEIPADSPGGIAPGA